MIKFYKETFQFLILTFPALNIMGQNYCDPGLCAPGTRHVACLNSGQFPSNCDGMLLNMQPYINLILQLHNEKRNLIAGGGVPRFPEAVRMGKATWDPQLALVAAYNAIQCRFQHDECRNTQNYRYAGQNLSILYDRNIDIVTFLRDRISSWFNEYQYATAADVENSSPSGGNQIGHFTVMVNERNNRVGCAISRYTDATRVAATLLVCDYAVTNIYNQPVYRFGPTASQCQTGRDSVYSNLCSVDEIYSYNQWSG